MTMTQSMAFLPRILTVCLAAGMVALFSAGCSGTSGYHYIEHEQRFPTTPRDQDIRLYVTGVTRPHLEIAYVQSFADAETEPDIKRRQLIQLQNHARTVGADAVINVRQMRQDIMGMVPDEYTPFPSVRQDTTHRYFLRGVAIKYLEELGEDAEEEAVLGSVEDIPVLEQEAQEAPPSGDILDQMF